MKNTINNITFSCYNQTQSYLLYKPPIHKKLIHFVNIVNLFIYILRGKTSSAVFYLHTYGGQYFQNERIKT